MAAKAQSSLKPQSPPKAYKVGGLPTQLDLEKALMFFHAYMYGPLQGKLRLYGARDVRVPTVAMPSDWEVVASILVGDLGKKIAAGIDLSSYEVKSAMDGGSYEYQYHKHGGKKKLRQEHEGGAPLFRSSRQSSRSNFAVRAWELAEETVLSKMA